MFFRLLLLFTVIPLIELFLLLEIGRLIGPVPTVALVLTTGALGAWLARSQGLQVIRRARHQWSSGEMPTETLADGILILIAGAVLITPGLLTDLTGFFLLTPFGRSMVLQALMKRLRAAIESRSMTVVLDVDG